MSTDEKKKDNDGYGNGESEKKHLDKKTEKTTKKD